MARGLKDMPPEILNAIVGLFGHGGYEGYMGLVNLRGVNKLFHCLVTPVLFETSCVWISTKSLQNLDRLAAIEEM